MRSSLTRLFLPFCLAAISFLAGCGGSSGSSSSSPTPTPTPTPITFETNGELPPAIVGVPYSFGFLATGGSGPLTYEMVNTLPLPGGLSLASNGLVTGIPTTPGQYTFQVTAVDSASTPDTASSSYIVQVRAAGATLAEAAHLNPGDQTGRVTVAEDQNWGASYAFVGTLGPGGAGSSACPDTGIRVYNLSNPANLGNLVSSFASGLGAAEPVAHIYTGLSVGGKTIDLAAVPYSVCPATAGARATSGGVAFYDVTNPANPIALGNWVSSDAGVNDVAVFTSNQALYALVALNTPETLQVTTDSNGNVTSGPTYPDPDGGDLALLSLGDLANVSGIQPTHWNLLKALYAYENAQLYPNGAPANAALTIGPLIAPSKGQDQRIFPTRIQLSLGGTLAYVSYWDGGVIVLDLSNPANFAGSSDSVFAGEVAYPILSAATVPSTVGATTTFPQAPSPTPTPSPSPSPTPAPNFSLPEGNTAVAVPLPNAQGTTDTGLLISDDVCFGSLAGASQTSNGNVAAVCGLAQANNQLWSTTPWGYFRSYSLTESTSNSGSSPMGAACFGDASACVQASPAGNAAFYATPQAQSDPPPDANGIYTAGDIALNGNDTDPHAFVAWYSSGLVDLDLRALGSPEVLTDWLPSNISGPALIDGAAAFTGLDHNQYVLATDIANGLYVLREQAAPAFAILNNAALPDGNLGVPYSETFTAATAPIGNGSLIWTIGDPTTLPPGLSGINAVLSGVPSTAGSYSFTVTVNDGAGDTAQAQESLTIDQNFAIVPPALLVGTLNETYPKQALTAVNYGGTVNWALASGSTLPPGLSLDASTGDISGTPTAAGTFDFTVQATESAPSSAPGTNQPATVTEPASIVVAPLTIATTSLPNAGVGVAYSQAITMENGTAPFTASIAASGSSTSLPSFIPATLTGAAGSNQLTISGTPTDKDAGTYTFTVTVTDADSNTASQSYTITVAPMSISPATLPNATVNQGYYQVVGVTNGASPYTFKVSNGSLPSWLTLNSSSGTLSGTPTSTTGSPFQFTITATDSSGNTASNDYTLNVDPAP